MISNRFDEALVSSMHIRQMSRNRRKIRESIDDSFNRIDKTSANERFEFTLPNEITSGKVDKNRYKLIGQFDGRIDTQSVAFLLIDALKTFSISTNRQKQLRSPSIIKFRSQLQHFSRIVTSN